MSSHRLAYSIVGCILASTIGLAVLAWTIVNGIDESRRESRDEVFRSITSSSTLATLAEAARRRGGRTTVVFAGIGFVSFLTTPGRGNANTPICPRAYDIMFGIGDRGRVLNPERMDSRCGLEAEDDPER